MAPLPLAHEMPRRRLRQAERHLQIEADDLAPILERHVEDQCVGIDAGIVDEDVERAEAGDGVGNEAAHRIVIEEIGFDEGTAGVFLELGDDGRAIRRAATGDDDLGAGRAERRALCRARCRACRR